MRDLLMGIENFKEPSAKYYVDKTLLLRDILEQGERPLKQGEAKRPCRANACSD